MNENTDLLTIELIEEHAFGYITDEELAQVIEEHADELNVSLINDYNEISGRISTSSLTENEEVFIYDLYMEGYLEDEVYDSLIENGKVNSERISMLLEDSKEYNSTDGDELSALIYRYSIIRTL